MLNMNNEEALAVIFANSYDALIPEMVSERHLWLPFRLQVVTDSAIS